MAMVHLGMNSVSGLCCMVQLSTALIAKASANAFGKRPPEIEKWHSKLGKFETMQPVFLFVANFYILVMKIKSQQTYIREFLEKRGQSCHIMWKKFGNHFASWWPENKSQCNRYKAIYWGEKKNGPSLPHYEEKNLVHLVQNPVMTPEYSESPKVDIITQ
jgi:hypothetical protein